MVLFYIKLRPKSRLFTKVWGTLTGWPTTPFCCQVLPLSSRPPGATYHKPEGWSSLEPALKPLSAARAGVESTYF